MAKRKKEKKIQDYNRAYAFLRHYVDAVLKLSYKRIRYIGTENVPSDGAVIYAPNHANALMDALIILAMDQKPKVFVARADIFRNPFLAKAFKFLKIMPIMRMRDGINEVKKNNETIEKSVDVLKDKIPFCIFPEGQHLAKHSAQPLSKGIFRIAFQAMELMGDTPLYIVPVGLQYGNFFRFRSTVRVEVGKPINVGEFLKTHAELTPQEQMNVLKEDLSGRIKSLITYIPDDENYNATYEVCAAGMKSQRMEMVKAAKVRGLNRKFAHFQANKALLEKIGAMKENQPEKFGKLMELGNEAYAERTSKEISLSSITNRFGFKQRRLGFLFSLLLLPYSIPASLLVLPINLACAKIFTLLKDYAFRNSVRFIFNLIVWPLLMIIYAVVAFSLAPWEYALAGVLLFLPAPIVAHEMWRMFRLERSDMKLMRNKKLLGIYDQIRQMLKD